jgi:hypothetical protein
LTKIDRHDLRKEADVLKEYKNRKDDVKVMPRYLLAATPEYFNLLMAALNLSEPVVTQVGLSMFVGP